MNYYPFHLGDYSADTAHLEPMEDLVYRRMLDLYYRTEKPLPEPEEIARLIRLRDHAATIRDILNEFFTPSEDGYRHARCDEEIARMQDKQAQQATKDEHEADRMRRHRERRAEMFAQLRAIGVVPAWDSPIKELQRLVDESCNAPATRTGELPETDLQRLSLPTPTPTPKKETPRASRLPADWVLPLEWHTWAANERPDLSALAVADDFRDYWVAKPGKDGTKLDWLATWRKWVRNANAPRRGAVAQSITVPGPDVWKPNAPLTPEEIAAADEVRRRVMPVLKRVATA